ncbi:hypothetical protein OBBRIDRAFT_808448 [Obba rivulosa]|uniref:Uncharacterized protein n=1 Tax=Obba rivulosa TaxID=1052685 RepID=A0A8E2DFT4_9APHY|nr:hypothetical protein OBBRIDRAFT_808448 [Obba rivulosa]
MTGTICMNNGALKSVFCVNVSVSLRRLCRHVKPISSHFAASCGTYKVKDLLAGPAVPRLQAAGAASSHPTARERLLTMWDRITGGTTVMFHIDGSRAPGKPLIADDVRVQSYLTPAIINEVPDASIIAARLAQLFTEGIAVPTMARWERAARQKGWFSNQKDIPVTHVTANAIPKPLLPTPEGAYYLFVGHPPGEIERLIAEIKGVNVKSSGTEELISEWEIAEGYYDRDHMHEQWGTEVRLLRQRISQLEEAVQACEADIVTLRHELRNLRSEGPTGRPSSAASTSSRGSIVSSHGKEKASPMVPSTPDPPQRTPSASTMESSKMSTRSPLATSSPGFPSSRRAQTFRPSTSGSMLHHPVASSIPSHVFDQPTHTPFSATPKHNAIRYYGVAVESIIDQLQLNASVHNLCWQIEGSIPYQNWVYAIYEHGGMSPKMAREVVKAMRADSGV